MSAAPDMQCRLRAGPGAGAPHNECLQCEERWRIPADNCTLTFTEVLGDALPIASIVLGVAFGIVAVVALEWAVQVRTSKHFQFLTLSLSSFSGAMRCVWFVDPQNILDVYPPWLSLIVDTVALMSPVWLFLLLVMYMAESMRLAVGSSVLARLGRRLSATALTATCGTLGTMIVHAALRTMVTGALVLMCLGLQISAIGCGILLWGSQLTTRLTQAVSSRRIVGTQAAATQAHGRRVARLVRLCSFLCVAYLLLMIVYAATFAHWRPWLWFAINIVGARVIDLMSISVIALTLWPARLSRAVAKVRAVRGNRATPIAAFGVEQELSGGEGGGGEAVTPAVTSSDDLPDEAQPGSPARVPGENAVTRDYSRGAS